jgi:hypothetical protein
MAFRFLPPQPSVCPGLHRARWRIRSRDADYSGGGNIGACDGMAAASHGRCALRRATRSRPAASSNAAGGLVNSDEPRGYNFDIDHDCFERVVWPALAIRFPAFEACRCRRTWSGLHEQNELDGNPIYTVERSRFGKGRRHRILVPFQTEARSLYVTHHQAGRIWGVFYVGGGR